MEYMDILWIALIVGGCIYLLYRSMWKKKGYCCGCDAVSCTGRKKKG